MTDTYDRLLAEVQTELGIDEDEAAGLISEAAVVITSRELAPTPWETIRKAIKAPAKLSWPSQLTYYREHAHEVWEASNGWRYHVLKSWQKDRHQRYARAFCLVDGFESELGDVYWSDILGHARRVR